MKFTLEHINKYVKGQLIGNKDLLIEGVSEINNSLPKTITFLGNPSYKKSSKHLNVGVIYLTKDQPTEAEIVWNHLKYEWWTTKNEWVPDIGATWSFVTRGLSTISTGVPKKIKK